MCLWFEGALFASCLPSISNAERGCVCCGCVRVFLCCIFVCYGVSDWNISVVVCIWFTELKFGYGDEKKKEHRERERENKEQDLVQ